MAAPAPLTEEVHKDTVLIQAVDRDGMAVSLIYSIFAFFGVFRRKLEIWDSVFTTAARAST